jgi:hypothetical protein
LPNQISYVLRLRVVCQKLLIGGANPQPTHEKSNQNYEKDASLCGEIKFLGTLGHEVFTLNKDPVRAM